MNDTNDPRKREPGDNSPLLPQPAPSFSNRSCIDCGEWSASGGARCEDCQEAYDYDS